MASGTLVRKVMLQIAADDGDTEAKLDKIAAKADELKEKHPELKVRIDTAAASAKLGVLRGELTAIGREKVEPEVKPKVDKVAAVAAGAESGQGFLSGFSPMAAGIGAAVAVTLAALPALFAAGGAAAGIALGAGLLIGTKKVQGPLYKSFHDMTSGLLSVLRVAALPLVKPLGEAFAQIGRWAKDMYPVLHQVFGALGPLVMPFARGLEGLVSGILPGFLTLMKAAQPAVAAVSGSLSLVGRSLGQLLSQLAPAVRPASVVLMSVIRIVTDLLPLVGTLSRAFAQILAPGLRMIATTVLPAVVRALDQVIGPVGRLAGSLLRGLMPIIPPLVRVLVQVSNAITGPLIAAISASVPAVGKIASSLSALFNQAVVPFLPPLLKLAGEFSQLNLQAVVPLIPPVLNLTGALLQLAVKAIQPLLPLLNAVANGMDMIASAATAALSPVSALMGLLGMGGGGSAAIGGGVAQYVTDPFGSGSGGSYSAGVSAATGAGYGAWASGQTGSTVGSTAGKKTAAKLRLSFSQALIQGLTGTASQVRSSINTILNDITREEQAGELSKHRGTAITLFVEKDSKRLQQLADRRAKIVAEIAAARKYAASVTVTAEQGGLMGAAGAATPQLGVGGIMTQLNADLARIREFGRNIAKLRKMGLNKAYLDQIIQAGPVAGGAIAQELANTNELNIKSINKVETQIGQAATGLGKSAADLMFDSGKQAGKGFLSGLLAQEKQLQAAMKHLADVLVQQLKKDLKIHSPSMVIHDLVKMVPAGAALALDEGTSSVAAAAARMARAVSGGTAGGLYGGGAAAARIEIHITGGDREFRTWLKKQIRVTGGNVSVVGA